MKFRILLVALVLINILSVEPTGAQDLDRWAGTFKSGEQGTRLNVDAELGGTDVVKRWDSFDGSIWVQLQKSGTATSQLVYQYKIGQMRYEKSYFVGPSSVGCQLAPCTFISCDLPNVRDYSCRVNDMAFDEDGYVLIAGSAFKAGKRMHGFVVVIEPANNRVIQRTTYAQEGFDILFQRIIRSSTPGKVLVSGMSISSFDQEQRAIVGRLGDGVSYVMDTTFDGDGLAVVDLGASTESADIIENTDGSVSLLTYARFTATSTPLSIVRKLKSTGKVDTSFGLGGSAYPYGLLESIPLNMAHGPESLYVLVKTWDATTNIFMPRLSRLKLNGSMDTGFSSDGKVDFNPDSFSRRTADTNEIYSVMSSSLSVYMVRFLSTEPSLLQIFRLTQTGDIDTTFGEPLNVGRVMVDTPPKFVWRDVDVTDDGTTFTVKAVWKYGPTVSHYAVDVVMYSQAVVAAGSSPPAGGTAAPSGNGSPSADGTSSNTTVSTGSVPPAQSSPSTILPPSNLIVNPLSRGFTVKWEKSTTPDAGYLVTASSGDDIRQCNVAAGANLACTFRNLYPWRSYQIISAAVVAGALSGGVRAEAKPIIVVKTKSAIRTLRIITPPRPSKQGKRTWRARGRCSLASGGTILVASSRKGTCTLTLVTGKSGKLPRVTRSVTLKVGK